MEGYSRNLWYYPICTSCFAKCYNEEEYSQCTYLAKGHCMDELKLSIVENKKEDSHGKQNRSKTVK